ncbi:hypothetical protein KY312_04585, partial [Candidatus Woesearchaeota archaeon]|nr:hypothetical protein [Candidatus Woesearchaeota archaeon]
MEENHHIVYMDMYLDKKFIARMHLTHKIKPATMIHFPKEASGKLTVVEFCNKHGRWIKEAEL